MKALFGDIKKKKKMDTIQELILKDLNFKMKFWRATAIFALLLCSVLFGLFIASESELARSKNQVKIMTTKVSQDE